MLLWNNKWPYISCKKIHEHKIMEWFVFFIFLLKPKLLWVVTVFCQETTFLFQLACLLKILCPSANNTELLFPWDMNYWFIQRICICCDICVFHFRNVCAQFDNRTARVLHGVAFPVGQVHELPYYTYIKFLYTLMKQNSLIRDMKTRITAPVSWKMDILWSEVYN